MEVFFSAEGSAGGLRVPFDRRRQRAGVATRGFNPWPGSLALSGVLSLSQGTHRCRALSTTVAIGVGLVQTARENGESCADASARSSKLDVLERRACEGGRPNAEVVAVVGVVGQAHGKPQLVSSPMHDGRG